jgi:hypothetical protein
MVLAILGVLLVAAAGVVRCAVLPSVAKLPSNSNTTAIYAGTARVLLDQSALASGSTAPLIRQNLPLRINESVRVLKSNAVAAVVEFAVLETAAGERINTYDYRYAVDRKTLQPSTAISASGLTPAHELTVSFPIGTERHDYTGWIQDTRTTTPLTFQGTATHVKVPTSDRTRTYAFGFQTYVFKQVMSPTPITDPVELGTLPSWVPKSELLPLAAALRLPASSAQLASLPNQVPLAYTYACNYTYWVAPLDGLTVDLQASETRTVELPASVLGVAVPLVTVSDFVYTDTLGTFLSLVHQAKNDASGLTLVGTTLPLLSLSMGFVLLVASALLGRRAFLGRRQPGKSTE